MDDIGPIEKAWLDYRRKIINPANTETQISQMRRVFYSGAMVSYVSVLQTGATGVGSDIDKFMLELQAAVH